MNTRKGYTLIEIIVVVCIISILFMIFANGIKAYNVLKNDMLVDQCNNSIMTFINNCKLYCYNNEVSGYILGDCANNKFNFYTAGTRQRVVKLPEGCKLHSINVASGTQILRMDSNGFTWDACTITYLDLYNVEHKITISVGTAYVEIKD